MNPDESPAGLPDLPDVTGLRSRGRHAGREVLVALTVALCAPAFVATTGAQIPIDGGSGRVI